MESNGVLCERTNTYTDNTSNRMNNSVNMSPKARPLPTFFFEQTTFSTKKEKIKETPKLSEIYIPKPPIKSCPPISRLKTAKKLDNDRARVISFANNTVNNNHLLNTVSKHYDENKTDLFFEQCFIIEGSLGCGSFGKVYKVKSKEDGKYYAIKKSREKFKGLNDRIRKLEEVAKHEQLPPHPNCVKFFRAWEEKQRLYICLELCQTSLSSYAENHHNIPESVIWRILIDLLQAVKHLHERNLVHMDIKPDNIFISHDGVCKLGDFGLVLDLKKNDLKEAQEGDPKYLAPEVLQNYNNITCAADIFSLGMTILELATDLDLPRSGDQWHQLRNGQVPSHLISSLSDSLVEIIMKMIEPDHLKRQSASQLLQMPKVKQILSSEKRGYFYSKTIACINQFSNCFYNMFVSLWYYVNNPWSLINTFKLFRKDEIVKQDIKAIRPDKNEQTSTPRKKDHLDNLLCFQTDDEDTKDHNDSFSTNNNSYVNPIIDTSSEFSDHSDIANNHEDLLDRKNSKTEPTKKKSIYLKTTRSSPCKTPPWKPMSNLYAYGTDNTPVGPTRLKFEDTEDPFLNSKNKIETFQTLSQTPSPTKHIVGLNDSSPSSDGLCLKLSFK